MYINVQHSSQNQHQCKEQRLATSDQWICDMCKVEQIIWVRLLNTKTTEYTIQIQIQIIKRKSFYSSSGIEVSIFVGSSSLSFCHWVCLLNFHFNFFLFRHYSSGCEFLFFFLVRNSFFVWNSEQSIKFGHPLHCHSNTRKERFHQML